MKNFMLMTLKIKSCEFCDESKKHLLYLKRMHIEEMVEDLCDFEEEPMTEFEIEFVDDMYKWIRSKKKITSAQASKIKEIWDKYLSQ